MENKHNLKNNLQEQSVQYFPLVNYNKIKSLEYAFPKILSYFFSTDLPFVHFCHFPFQRYRKWCKCFPGTALCAGSMQSKQVCLGQIFACAGFSCTDFNKLSKDNDCSQRGLCQVMLAEAPDLCVSGCELPILLWLSLLDCGSLNTLGTNKFWSWNQWQNEQGIQLGDVYCSVQVHLHDRRWWNQWNITRKNHHYLSVSGQKPPTNMGHKLLKNFTTHLSISF